GTRCRTSAMSRYSVRSSPAILLAGARTTGLPHAIRDVIQTCNLFRQLLRFGAALVADLDNVPNKLRVWITSLPSIEDGVGEGFLGAGGQVEPVLLGLRAGTRALEGLVGGIDVPHRPAPKELPHDDVDGLLALVFELELYLLVDCACALVV